MRRQEPRTKTQRRKGQERLESFTLKLCFIYTCDGQHFESYVHFLHQAISIWCALKPFPILNSTVRVSICVVHHLSLSTFTWFLPHVFLLLHGKLLYLPGGDFTLEKFRWINFVTRFSHLTFNCAILEEEKKPTKIFAVQNLSCQKSSAPSAPFPLFLMYLFMDLFSNANFSPAKFVSYNAPQSTLKNNLVNFFCINRGLEIRIWINRRMLFIMNI